ncbi:hypothetical protein BZL41_08705 [Pseudomonas sp. PIC25]|uniref:hypothetical protein n=1 Tax=Pseudomonas sp. PIC25 TaxID=1958773 RepID=UPI000BAB492B|nr:hypothetical protein [Pseudomonas sp. PIC25]PAU64798.1 hypothetical protein BZL41_08705 [Pseudomonas sp. PIC25]
MNKIKQALCLSLSLTALGVATLPAQANVVRSPAQAETPVAVVSESQQTAPSVFAQVESAQGVSVASLATSCDDPRPWYRFSGIEALTCLLSGQW